MITYCGELIMQIVLSISRIKSVILNWLYLKICFSKTSLKIIKIV